MERIRAAWSTVRVGVRDVGPRQDVIDGHGNPNAGSASGCLWPLPVESDVDVGVRPFLISCV
eukprot:7166124-Heterocapsa_arctica.AAC.1